MAVGSGRADGVEDGHRGGGVGVDRTAQVDAGRLAHRHAARRVAPTGLHDRSVGVVIEVLQVETEFAQLRGLYEKVSPACVLEIGTYQGGTLREWLTRGDP